MKTMKVALLASAALAAVSVSARADDTAAIKAQLEALNARIAQLEAAPAAPVGYSLLTISEGTATVVPGLEVLNKDAAGYGDKATIIGIMPSADVPASTTIEWSGYVRAAITYNDYNDNWDPSDVADYSDVDVAVRGQLKVVGKTDTAVGEVGAQIQLRGEGFALDTKSAVTMSEAWGWWAMTPELTLGGGYTGSLGNVGYGYDGACSCYYIDGADVYTNPGDANQIRLSWASGPISMAIAVEDASGTQSDDGVAAWTTGETASSVFAGGQGDLGAAAEIKYTGDVMSGEISAVWHEAPVWGKVLSGDYTSSYTDGVDSYMIGAGLGFGLGDMASISLAANAGRTNTGANFWDVNALLSANLSDAIHGELGAGYKDYGNSNGYTGTDRKTWGIMGGLYYEPVSQLTIGLEAEYSKTTQYGTYNAKKSTVDFVTVYRF